MSIWIRRATIGGAMVGLFAFSAVRLGERPKGETNAIATLKVINSGEVGYAASNGGYYDTLECLASGRCLPGVSGSSNGYVSSDLASAEPQHGYRFHFHAGPAPDRALAPGASRSSMTGYAVVAVPEKAGTYTRAFCIDADGTIYQTPADVTPAVERGRCVDRSRPLR